jgi:hypothetical protein
MILFTGRSIYITKMPNKPISQEYKFFCMAKKGYIWEFHPLSGEDSLVLRMRKHPGNKSTNAGGANSIFFPGECQKELDIPIIVDAYIEQKVGVDVADQYQTYFDTQLISRHN